MLAAAFSEKTQGGDTFVLQRVPDPFHRWCRREGTDVAQRSLRAEIAAVRTFAKVTLAKSLEWRARRDSNS